MKQRNPLTSKKLWITIASLVTLAGVTAIQAWQGFADFDKVIGAILVLGGGSTLLQAQLDQKQPPNDG